MPTAEAAFKSMTFQEDVASRDDEATICVQKFSAGHVRACLDSNYDTWI